MGRVPPYRWLKRSMVSVEPKRQKLVKEPLATSRGTLIVKPYCRPFGESIQSLNIEPGMWTEMGAQHRDLISLLPTIVEITSFGWGVLFRNNLLQKTCKAYHWKSSVFIVTFHTKLDTSRTLKWFLFLNYCLHVEPFLYHYCIFGGQSCYEASVLLSVLSELFHVFYVVFLLLSVSLNCRV